MAVESGLRQRIAELLRIQGFFVQSIESETNPGMPDMYWRKGEAGWLELKHVKVLPKRETTSLFKSLNHPLLIEQINWIDLELEHCGRAEILVGYQRDYFLVPGEQCRQFNDFTWNDLQRYKVDKYDIPYLILEYAKNGV